MTKKTTQFKHLLLSGQIEFLMEAHNGLSAKIAEEAGFKGIWASGLSISAALGVRDSNEASWTQILDVLEFISDATTIPVLADCDTGYGNFNNVRRLVRKLEQRNIAAMCLEDKVFPKTNSFVASEQQSLADIDEFAGKIKAAKDAQQDPDFCVVARTEAFIVGRGLAEALKRAESYCRAGADAVLVHSKSSNPDQVLSFMAEWQNTCPVVIIPTNYCNTPSAVFVDAGISVIIWANHMLRSSIAAIQRTAKKLHETQFIPAIESEIVPFEEVLRLQNMQELQMAEQIYLPRRKSAIPVKSYL